jgi:hypothetical protein
MKILSTIILIQNILKKRCKNPLLGIILILFFTPLFAEVSNKTHSKLKNIKSLIEKSKFQKAKSEIEKLPKHKLSPLENDLLKYFKANIYFLEGQQSLAMLGFATLVNSKNLDKSMISEIKNRLLKIHFDREEYNLALDYLSEEREDFEANIIRYFAYKKMKNFKESFYFLEKEIFKSDDIVLWKDYLDFRKKLKKREPLDILPLLENIDDVNEVQKFSKLFAKRELFFQAVQIYEKGFQLGILPIREKVKFVKIAKKLNNSIYFGNLLRKLLKTNPYDFFKLEYANHLFHIGEFKEAIYILKSVKSEKKYILLGDIFEASGDRKRAIREWKKGLNYFKSVIEAKERLKKYSEK